MASRRPSGGDEGANVPGGAFQQVVQVLLQEALRLQEQQTERRTQDALRLQEQKAATELRVTVSMMQQERDQAIRDLREEFRTEIQRMEKRMDRMEEQVISPVRSAGSEVSGEKGSLVQLTERMGNLEEAVQRALSSVFPRVEALVAQLEETSPPKAPRDPYSDFAASSTSTSSSTSISTSTSSTTSTSTSTSSSTSISSTSPRLPAAMELAAPAPGGDARKEPVVDQRAAALDEERARQRMLLRLRLVRAKMDSTRAGPSPLGDDLCRAARKGKLGEVRRLLDAGANANYTNAAGDSPLIASQRGFKSNPHIVSSLLEKGAEVNALNENGMTALHYASIFHRSDRCLGLLVAAGADVDARDEDGSTPLHCAACSNNEAAVRALLAAGAKKNLRCWSEVWRGKTPFDLASYNSTRDLLRH